MCEKKNYQTMNKKRLRNTYRVPAGEEVVVDTPQGEKKYGGGQFVPPEQMNKAKIKTAEDKSKKGTKSDPNEPGWPDIVENFKAIDLSDIKQVNIACYQLKDFFPYDINNKIKGVPIFAVELSIANLVNSMPGYNIVEDLNIEVTNRVKGIKNLLKVGDIDLQQNKITIYNNYNKPQNILFSISKFTSFAYNLIFMYNLTQNIANSKIIEGYKTKIQQVSQNTSQENPPQENAKQDKEQEKQMQIQIQQLNQVMQISQQLNKTIKVLQQKISNEGYMAEYLNDFTDPLLATCYNSAKLLSYANVYSFGVKKTFEQGLEKIAENYPSTTFVLKSILQICGEMMKTEQEEE